MNAERDEELGDVTITEIKDFEQTIPGAIAADAINTAQQYMRLAEKYHKRACDLLIALAGIQNYAIAARNDLAARRIPTPMALELIITEAGAVIEQFKKQRKEAEGS